MQDLGQIFERGGPLMWPLLVTSLVALTVVLERIVFLIGIQGRRAPATVEAMLAAVERGELAVALRQGESSRDFVARVLTEGLRHRDTSLSQALLRAGNRELKVFARGLALLDTSITLAPLLGLLGTVSGMIRCFGLLGGSELDAPATITGGIAEALIATAFGLGIAIVALLPFNLLNSRLETARHEIEDAATHLELLLLGRRGGGS